MRKPNLDVWARVAEIGTAFVVVVSLVYIAFELDQNTRAIHTASWEAVNEMLVTLDINEATELGPFIERAELSPNDVEPGEYWRFARLAQARLGVIEYAYLGIETGTLSTYHWGALSGYLEFTMCKKGYQKVWSEIGKLVYHIDFQTHVNSIIGRCKQIDGASEQPLASVFSPPKRTLIPPG